MKAKLTIVLLLVMFVNQSVALKCMEESSEVDEKSRICPSKVCKQLPGNKDFKCKGSCDMKKTPVANESECCRKCEQNPNCTHYTFNTHYKECYLKNNSVKKPSYHEHGKAGFIEAVDYCIKRKGKLYGKPLLEKGCATKSDCKNEDLDARNKCVDVEKKTNVSHFKGTACCCNDKDNCNAEPVAPSLEDFGRQATIVSGLLLFSLVLSFGCSVITM